MWTMEHIQKITSLPRSRDMPRIARNAQVLPQCIAMHNYARPGGITRRSKLVFPGRLGRLGLPKRRCQKMCQACIEVARGPLKNDFPSLPRWAGVITTCGDVNCLKSREEATKNVQIASGGIKNWYESSEGVSRCYCEVLLRHRFAAMPLSVADETGTAKSGIKNQKWSRETDLRRHKSTKQVYR
jgi:hypothetical protein